MAKITEKRCTCEKPLVFRAKNRFTRPWCLSCGGGVPVDVVVRELAVERARELAINGEGGK